MPPSVAGQINTPPSDRLVNRDRASASAKKIFTVSPLRSRKINRWLENWFLSSTFCTSSPRPLNDLHIFMTPATSQIRGPDGRDIIGFSRLAGGAAPTATLITGSQASFFRGGTQHNRMRHSVRGTDPGVYVVAQ